MNKLKSFLAGIRKESKKIRWPNKNEMIKYSVSTLFVVVIFSVFFTISDLMISGIKLVIK